MCCCIIQHAFLFLKQIAYWIPAYCWISPWQQLQIRRATSRLATCTGVASWSHRTHVCAVWVRNSAVCGSLLLYSGSDSLTISRRQRMEWGVFRVRTAWGVPNEGYKTRQHAFLMHVNMSPWSCRSVHGENLNTNWTLSMPLGVMCVSKEIKHYELSCHILKIFRYYLM